jgi:hypothetical protein
MTLQDFDLLDPVAKLFVIADRSVFLARRTDDAFRVSLYQLDGFYIEIYFHAKELMYKQVRCFADIDELDKYLDSIDISDCILH